MRVMLLSLMACSTPVEPTPLKCVLLVDAPNAVVWISPVPNMRCVVPQ